MVEGVDSAGLVAIAMLVVATGLVVVVSAE